MTVVDSTMSLLPVMSVVFLHPFVDVLQTRGHDLQALAGTQDSVSVIAASLGYAGVSNFCRAFRKWTGETPRAYRARIRASDPDTG